MATLRLIRCALSAGLLTMALAGCSAASPPLWLLYADAKELYGRLSVQAEHLCATPTPATSPFCAEAVATRAAIKTTEPVIRTELSRATPDWAVIMKYVQLILGLVGAARP
jgi:hypothetical protein